MSARRLRVAMRVPITRAEGPGARYALWVAGCSIRCPGCCNPHLFDEGSGEAIDVAALAAEVGAVRGSIEGVTFLGGEPFEQAEALADLAEAVRANGLGVMTFTGYRLEELTASDRPGVRRLLDATDLLVDGRYDAARPERERRWAGSTNQRFHHLSGRYESGLERIGPGEEARRVEVSIGPDTLTINGWPDLLRLAGRPSRPASPSRGTRASSSGS